MREAREQFLGNEDRAGRIMVHAYNLVALLALLASVAVILLMS